ncbi:MAG: GNAT family N-acetyltransferase [Saprospiraceae bacterium]|nr:GNAT family N-acetyltransferase [Saprospiraceae bacterium]
MKLKSENILMNISVGVFEGSQLIALMLHGYTDQDGIKSIYNAGTGVIPSKRGKKIATQMFQYIIPILKKMNIHMIQLEVLTQNTSAIKLYKNVGFDITRQLYCYRGKIADFAKPVVYKINNLPELKWEYLKSLWSWNPTWQNGIQTIEKLLNSCTGICIYDNNILAGYLLYNLNINRVLQFAVHKNHQHKGIGQHLWQYLGKQNNNEWSVINVDSKASQAKKFLVAQGLKIYIKQFEMQLNL